MKTKKAKQNNNAKKHMNANKSGMSQEVVYLIIGGAVAIAALIYYGTRSQLFCKLTGLC
jgi:type VI protein secretion system component VasF